MAYEGQENGSIGTGAGVKRRRVFEGVVDGNRNRNKSSSSNSGGIPKGVLE
jgi:hypothetical protein